LGNLGCRGFQSSHAGGSSSPGHSAAADPVGLLGPPIHNMGLCSRPREDPNACKQFGPEPTWAIEPRYRPPGQQWIPGEGLRGGVPSRSPFWRTPEESCKGLGSVTLKNKHSTHTLHLRSIGPDIQRPTSLAREEGLWQWKETGSSNLAKPGFGWT
jgi:hypothetical protein